MSQEVIKLLLPQPVSLNRIDKGGAGHAGELRYSAGKVQRIDVLQRAAASQTEESVRPGLDTCTGSPKGARLVPIEKR